MLSEGRQQRNDIQVADGSINPARFTGAAAIATADAHARYLDAVRRGNVYTACNQAGVALSVNSATATGLIVTNPSTSGKNFVFLELLVALTTAPAGISTLALVGKPFSGGAAAAVTHTTPMTTGFGNALFGAGSNSVALVDTAATIPTPQTVRPVPGGPVATGSINSMFIKDQIDGALILGPGGVISLQCLTTAISALASLTWEEVPI